MRILILFSSLLPCSTMLAAVYPSSYDVVYDRLSISVDPGTSAAISGTVTTYFKSTTANLSRIGFDLEQHLTVSTVTYHGSPTSYSQSGDVLLIQFPAPIATSGMLDSVTISWSGTPVTPTTNIPSGYNRATHNGGNYIIYTLGEAFTGHTWWPCKDSLTDKIDSLDLIVTTPAAYKVGANGIVTESVTGSTKVSTWKTRYPIPTYLVNFAVANYQDYAYTINTGLSTPTSLPVHNYLFPEDNTTTKHNALNSIQSILPAYVSLLNTDYPFLNEKYGTAECTNFGGALEVQSMTFVSSGSYNTSILAHELSHQWFGDRVTTNDWHQIWLNEGFAEFFQYVIYPELLQSAASAQSSRQSLKSWVSNTSTTWVPDISDVDNIFIPSSATAQPYEKGAMTLSMLRAWLGDNNFYKALYNYLNAPGLAYNFTSVDSLRSYMQAMAPSPALDLTNFFQDWVYQPGQVQYVVNYQFSNRGIYFNLSQSPTASGAGYFDMPVPIEIKGPGLDTTVVIIDRRGSLYNSATGASGGSIIHYNLSATPTSLSFDPQNKVLATATLNPVTTLPLMDIDLAAKQQAGQVQLSWLIRTGQAISEIFLERSSNGQDFKAIHQEPAGTPAPSYAGIWTDDQPLPAASWYRIRVRLPDGSLDYSPVKLVEPITQENQLIVSPNPVTGAGTVLVHIPANITGPMTLILFNAAGQQLQQQTVNSSQATLYTANLPAGAYELVLLSNNHQQLTTTFIKK